MFVISTRNFPPDVGGIQNLIEGLSKSLINHGPVKVFAEKYENSEKYDDHSSLNIERISGLKIFSKYRKASLLNEFIKNNNVRAVFFDHWKSIEKVNDGVLAKAKSFCLIHSKEINHEIGTSLNNRMIKSLNKAKFIISNSAFTKELAIKMGVKNNNIKIINPGCNYPIEIESEFSEKAKEIFGTKSFPKIITVARLDKRKSHQNILMTIKNLIPTYPDIKYVCIGDGEEKSNLEELRKQLGIEKQVTFLSIKNDDLKIAFINECDLFLMPSVIYK